MCLSAAFSLVDVLGACAQNRSVSLKRILIDIDETDHQIIIILKQVLIVEQGLMPISGSRNANKNILFRALKRNWTMASCCAGAFRFLNLFYFKVSFLKLNQFYKCYALKTLTRNGKIIFSMHWTRPLFYITKKFKFKSLIEISIINSSFLIIGGIFKIVRRIIPIRINGGWTLNCRWLYRSEDVCISSICATGVYLETCLFVAITRVDFLQRNYSSNG